MLKFLGSTWTGLCWN